MSQTFRSFRYSGLIHHIILWNYIMFSCESFFIHLCMHELKWKRQDVKTEIKYNISYKPKTMALDNPSFSFFRKRFYFRTWFIIFFCFPNAIMMVIWQLIELKSNIFWKPVQTSKPYSFCNLFCFREILPSFACPGSSRSFLNHIHMPRYIHFVLFVQIILTNDKVYSSFVARILPVECY